MEQHKVLLIIVSVAIVLAAVVGVGLWLFYPRDGAGTDLAQDGRAGDGGFEWQPLDYLQGQGDVPGLEDEGVETVEEPDEFEVTYGVLPDSETTDSGDRQTAVRTEITTAPPVEEDEPGDEPVMVEVPPAADVAAAVPRTEATSTAETVRTTAASTRTTGSGEAESTSTSTSSRSSADLADRAYWVQAISSPNLDTVEQARVTLREHQLGSRILTKVIDGRTYYRLRVGPFAVRAEAEKFLGWVQDISGFADAMIFVDYNTPVLAARPQ